MASQRAEEKPLLAEVSQPVSQLPDVSRADPLVDEARDIFLPGSLVLVDEAAEECAEAASLAEDEGQDGDRVGGRGGWGGR